MNIGDWNSFFGEGTYLKGTLKFKGSLRFEGDFEGMVETGDIFIVGKTGKVAASIKTGSLYNFGQISGDVEAIHKVSLHAKSRLKGDIRSPILVTEESAWFQGSCVMPKLPKGGAPETPKSLLTGKGSPGIDEISAQVIAEEAGAAAGSGGSSKGLVFAFFFLLLAAAAAAGWYFLGQGALNSPDTSALIETKAATSSSSSESGEPIISANVDPDLKKKTEEIAEPERPEPEIAQEGATEKVAETPPPKPVSKISIAVEKIENREYINAISLLEELIKEKPKDAVVRNLYAQILLKTGREKDAGDQFRTLARLNPSSIEVKNNIAYVKLSNGSYKEAQNAFTAVIKSDPENLRAKLGLATALSRQGKNSQAIIHCKDILKVMNDYSPAKNRLAWIYTKQGGNLKEAQELSKRSMEFFTDIPDYIDTLAEVNYKMKNYDEAIELIEKAINLAPKEPYYRRQMFKFKHAKSASS